MLGRPTPASGARSSPRAAATPGWGRGRRTKSARLKDQPSAPLNPETILAQLTQFEAEARSRGVTHTTFRRIAEALGFGGNQRRELGQLLIDNCPEQYDVPLWRIAAEFES
ncbi:hypothetical protein [Streptomyces griseofuscus]|uniref:Uncharacterized protein n=1 Tax=Streptomyces griseofuscus TaxID=146922 RepID=A0A3R8QE09_9ACTN|nr:hypothetical protein [Streptomyces griseofuscus]RRQ83569.1 hypothetical protein CQW44_24315 [Streptomyces griseofuscus]